MNKKRKEDRRSTGSFSEIDFKVENERTARRKGG